MSSRYSWRATTERAAPVRDRDRPGNQSGRVVTANEIHPKAPAGSSVSLHYRPVATAAAAAAGSAGTSDSVAACGTESQTGR